MEDLDPGTMEEAAGLRSEKGNAFICPCCGATGEELSAEVGLNADGKEKNNDHGHHDHITDYLKRLIKLGASSALVFAVKTSLEGFTRTRVCHRCNNADRGLLKETFIAPFRPELYDLISFPPSAIRDGVIRVPGGKHVLHPRAADILAPDIQLVIRRAEQAADLIRGVRNATIGAERHEIGEIIDTVFEEFLRHGSPLEIRCEKSGPLSWKALYHELNTIPGKTDIVRSTFGQMSQQMSRLSMILEWENRAQRL